MLGIQYKQISSLSMGYKTDVDMKAMDFEEFLRAKGYGDEAFESIYAKMRTAKPLDALELKVFGGLFRDFCVLGGMPEVVGGYVTTGTVDIALLVCIPVAAVAAR